MGALRKVNRAWLTRSETAEYDRRLRLRAVSQSTEDTGPLPGPSRARLRAVQWWYIGAGVGVTILASMIAAVAYRDPVIGDDPGLSAMVVGMGTAFMALCIGGLAFPVHVHHAYTRWIVEYLNEIGYFTRTGPPATTRSARTGMDYGGGRSYPVTDGMHDPELYVRRGGRATLGGMRRTGIDDYQTYENNVLEAE